MPGPVFRRGELVALRTVESEDVEFLQRLVNDPQVRRGTAQIEPINRIEEEEYVEALAEEDGVSTLVCVDGDPVGTIGFEERESCWGTAEVGYMIAPEEWDNGYATDALRELCAYGFEERRFAKVVARAYEPNGASRRVLEKAGFTEEGCLRREAFIGGERVDVYRYGLLASEWDGRGTDGDGG